MNTLAPCVTGPAGRQLVVGDRRRGRLDVPEQAVGIVVFAHGGETGGRSSLRDRYVAELLQAAGLATLRLDLLDPHEARAHGRRAVVRLLAGRLVTACRVVRADPSVRDLSLALFGSGVGVAAALIAARSPDVEAVAVVGRAAAVDLVPPGRVDVPTLLLTGDDDHAEVVRQCRHLRSLAGVRRLDVLAGAASTFDDPVMLRVVAARASLWILDQVRAG